MAITMPPRPFDYLVSLKFPTGTIIGDREARVSYLIFRRHEDRKA
jgi:hypothetical protein